MIIRNNSLIIYILTVWIALAITVITFISIFGFIFPILIYLFVMLYLCICSTLVFGREIMFDKDGCTIRLLGYKKKYLWSNLNVKIENCRDKLALRGTSCIRILQISPYSIPNTLFRHPNFYSVFVHPFSFVFIYLSEGKISSSGLLMMSEEEFKKQMSEWGKTDIIKEIK